jgi:erythritol transport system permease protein
MSALPDAAGPARFTRDRGIGVAGIARGAALLASNGETFSNLVGRPRAHDIGVPAFGAGTFLEVPVSVIVLAAVGRAGRSRQARRRHDLRRLRGAGRSDRGVGPSGTRFIVY